MRKRKPTIWGRVAGCAMCSFVLLALTAHAGADDASALLDDAGAAAYQLGAQLWEQFAPPDVKKAYHFPSRAEWERFWQTIEGTLQEGSVEDLAALRPYALDAVQALQLIPQLKPYAAWLHARLAYFDAGELYLRARTPQRRTPERRNWNTAPPASKHLQAPLPADIRGDAFWEKRVKRRPASAGGAALAQRLKPVFVAASIPPGLVWLAEVESSMRADARSPVGAVGLFQLMPATAKRFGLSLEPQDERKDPEKSARAAAAYLALLHRRFQSWPLALAAYNAGEGRVGRAMTKHKATTFEQVADHLPSETQLYVPNVLATIHTREGVDLR